MHVHYEDGSWDKVYNDILNHCDKRLQTLADVEQYGIRWKIDDIEDDELKEAALWLNQNGFSSVKEMIGNIIDTLQYDLELDDMNDVYNAIKLSDKTDNGYKVPLVKVRAKLKAPKIYVVGHYMLPLYYSQRCWKTLNEFDWEHLESIDWKNMSYDDYEDIELVGVYNIFIHIDWHGDVIGYESDAVFVNE